MSRSTSPLRTDHDHHRSEITHVREDSSKRTRLSLSRKHAFQYAKACQPSSNEAMEQQIEAPHPRNQHSHQDEETMHFTRRHDVSSRRTDALGDTSQDQSCRLRLHRDERGMSCHLSKGTCTTRGCRQSHGLAFIIVREKGNVRPDAERDGQGGDTYR